MNAVFSPEKEELRGDFHNLVLVTEHVSSCSRDTASTDAMVSGMQSAMRGYYDWSRRTQRYAPTGFIPADQPAYLNVVTPRCR
jgi:hypothetical protein